MFSWHTLNEIKVTIFKTKSTFTNSQRRPIRLKNTRARPHATTVFTLMNLQCSVIIGYIYTEISSQIRHHSVQLGAWMVYILIQVTEASEV